MTDRTRPSEATDDEPSDEQPANRNDDGSHQNDVAQAAEDAASATAQAAAGITENPRRELKKHSYRTRSRISWTLTLIVAFMLGLEALLPGYAPQPTIVASVLGTVVTLLILQRNGSGGEGQGGG
jgi:hypothetical protein